MLENSGFAALFFNIELATGRVRPQADKGLLDPPDETPRFLREICAPMGKKEHTYTLDNFLKIR